ncbi:axin interactor, dorsalization-associated protein isoform X3 [Anarhichas minor]|uniref:axin interactor, dorsalization-associated protein isoform X3 n=1 Tax=Anarhichas minor TaxID=65739 RepID=UPI003F7316B6
MSEVNKTIQKWHTSFKKGTDFDSWGQLVEAVDEYHILARQLQKEVQSTNAFDFTEEQKKTLGKIATCLEMRSASLQCTQSKEDFKLEELKKLETIIQNILTYNKEFPFDVQPVPLRKILAPGEEESLELEEEEEDAAAGAGSTEAFPPRAPGTVRPVTHNKTHQLLRGCLIICVLLSCFGGLFDCVSFCFSLSVLCMASSLIPACFICSFARYLVATLTLGAWADTTHTKDRKDRVEGCRAVHRPVHNHQYQRFERRRCEPCAGHTCGLQEGRYLHSLQCGGRDPETRGEITKRSSHLL